MVIVMVIVIDNEKVSEKKLAWIEEDHLQERGITALLHVSHCKMSGPFCRGLIMHYACIVGDSQVII